MKQPKVEFLVEPGCPISEQLESILRESSGVIAIDLVNRQHLPSSDPRRQTNAGRILVNELDVSGSSASPNQVKRSRTAISKEDLQDRLARALLLA